MGTVGTKSGSGAEAMAAGHFKDARKAGEDHRLGDAGDSGPVRLSGHCAPLLGSGTPQVMIADHDKAPTAAETALSIDRHRWNAQVR